MMHFDLLFTPSRFTFTSSPLCSIDLRSFSYLSPLPPPIPSPPLPLSNTSSMKLASLQRVYPDPYGIWFKNHWNVRGTGDHSWGADMWEVRWKTHYDPQSGTHSVKTFHYLRMHSALSMATVLRQPRPNSTQSWLISLTSGLEAWHFCWSLLGL